MYKGSLKWLIESAITLQGQFVRTKEKTAGETVQATSGTSLYHS